MPERIKQDAQDTQNALDTRDARYQLRAAAGTPCKEGKEEAT